ncbi:hypothetical protein FOA52_009521, partial [Chlamydomonas sp. UWO 241]
VLGVCDDAQRELLLTRVRTHLASLKKLTYGKHIVSRVEKLLFAGARTGGGRAVNYGGAGGASHGGS